jgi:hypothetical protein
VISDVEPTEISIDGLKRDETIYVHAGRRWSFLEDMGYVRIVGIPGQVVHLIGTDAKTAFLSGRRPTLREVHVLCDLKVEDLYSVGILTPDELTENRVPVHSSEYGSELRALWDSGRYVDFDKPIGDLAGNDDRLSTELEEGEVLDVWDDDGAMYLDY